MTQTVDIKTKDGQPDGFYPHQLRTYVDIDQGQFDYWKRNLQPKLKYKMYRDADLLAYMVMKEAIVGWGLKIPWLKKVDWVLVFDGCHEVEPEFLESCRFVFDLIEHEVIFLDQKDENPLGRKRSQLRIVNMDEIIAELFENMHKGYPTVDKKVVSAKEFKIARVNKHSKMRKAEK